MQGGDKVDTYVEALWSEWEPSFNACDTWYAGFKSFDYLVRHLAGDIRLAALDGKAPPLRFSICNSETSVGTGLHWFTVVWSIEWDPDP